MKEKENLKEELAEMAPFLSKMKTEKEGLVVPKNYFHNLTIEVMDQLGAENQEVNQKQSKENNWLLRLKRYWESFIQPRPIMAFTSILLLVVAGLFLMNQSTDANESLGLSDISIEELDLYLEENIEDFDSEILVEGNEQILQEGFESEAELDDYLEEIIDEGDLEDLL